MNSSRLKSKHFSKIADAFALKILIDTILNEFLLEIQEEKICFLIATGSKQENAAFEFFAKEKIIKVFYGDDSNVPLRHSQAIEKFSLTGVVAVDGDDILCCPRAIREVHTALKNGHALFKTSGLPIGMNCWGYSAEALNRAGKYFRNIRILETGWGLIFKNEENKLLTYPASYEKLIRATLDYEEDRLFFDQTLTKIFDWREFSTLELCQKILDLGLNRLNIDLDTRYWENFYSEKNR